MKITKIDNLTKMNLISENIGYGKAILDFIEISESVFTTVEDLKKVNLITEKLMKKKNATNK